MGTEVTEVVERKTPLYDTHVKYKGKIVPFAGYLLPVQYDTGVIGEHMAVRTRCGLFDVSHMGEIICRGKDALQNLNMLLTNDYTVMAEGQARYSPMCNEEGGVVDDLIVYKVRDNCYFIVVNAANKDKDYAWMKARQFGDVVFEDISDRVAQLALQGPKAMDVLKKVAKEEIPDKYYTCRFDCMIGDIRCTRKWARCTKALCVPSCLMAALWRFCRVRMACFTSLKSTGSVSKPLRKPASRRVTSSR